MTFDNGYFILDHPPVKLWDRDRWEKYGSYFRTQDLRAAFRQDDQADSKAKEELDRYRNRAYRVPAKGIPDHLLDVHQQEGVRWILSRKASYLAHAPGAGKTIQAIVAANLAGGDTLIICPPLLVTNWEKEILAWGKKPTSIFHIRDLGALPQIKGAPAWVLCPDSILARRDVLGFLYNWKWTTVVVDEASRYKESGAQRTRAVFGGEVSHTFVTGLQHHTKRMVLLDGSPMPNRTRELWAPIYHCSPETIGFMDEREFGFRYCGPTMNDYGAWEFRGESHTPELRRKLTKNFYHIVKEEELSHPERVRRMLFMSEDVRTPSMRNWEIKNVTNLSKMNPSGDLQLANYLQELGLRKVPWAARYIKERTLARERLLVFFWHQKVGDELQRALQRDFPFTPLITGQTPMKTRVSIFESFQRGNVPVILGNVLAMGRGVNLQEADRVIFVEYTWSDETNLQAEKRTSRRGSTKLIVPCDYLACPDSLDEAKLRTLFRKQKLVARLIANEPEVVKGVTNG